MSSFVWPSIMGYSLDHFIPSCVDFLQPIHMICGRLHGLLWWQKIAPEDKLSRKHTSEMPQMISLEMDEVIMFFIESIMEELNLKLALSS